MTEKSFFDHLEVHVQDVPRYCDFLVQIFDGGEFRIIDDNGTSMFKSPESLFIEIKKKIIFIRIYESWILSALP
jgi:hypothetical protein